MAGLPWVKVATDFADDPKAFDLALRLNDPRAPLYLPPTWAHFARHYADGTMPETDGAVRALEAAARWPGEPGALVEALVHAGLLERRRGRLAVHAWDKWQAPHAEKLARDKARMRQKRAESRGKGRATVEQESRDGRAEEERERRGDEEEQQQLARGRADEASKPAAPLPGPEVVGDAGRESGAVAARAASGPVEDVLPRPQLVVVDEGGGFEPGPDPWPRATSFRHAITLRMARTVLYPIGGVEPKIMGSLQDSLGVIAEAEAVEVCAGRVVEAVQLRRRQPGSLAYFAQVLADEAVRRRALGVTSLEPAAPAPLSAAGCPEWERLRAALRERVRPETFAKFHAPLVGRMEAGALVLVAPDRYVAAFLADEHRAVFEEWARELGVAAAVRFEAADVAAAGGAG